jgi:hypothetical protein
MWRQVASRLAFQRSARMAKPSAPRTYGPRSGHGEVAGVVSGVTDTKGVEPGIERNQYVPAQNGEGKVSMKYFARIALGNENADRRVRRYLELGVHAGGLTLCRLV